MAAIFYVFIVLLACSLPTVSSGTPVDTTTNPLRRGDNFVDELTSKNEQEIVAFLDKLEALHFGSDRQMQQVHGPLSNETSNAPDGDIVDFINKLDSVNEETGDSFQTTSKQPLTVTTSPESTNQDIWRFIERLDSINSEKDNDTKLDPTSNVTSQGSTVQDILNFIKKLDETNPEVSTAPVVESTTVKQLDDATTIRSQDSSFTRVATTVLPNVDHSEIIVSSSKADVHTDVTESATLASTFGAVEESSNDQEDSQNPLAPVKVGVVATSYYTPVLIGICISAVLVVLVIAVLIWKCSNRRSKDLSLNKEFNRWDPQLLRPTKADIDAFIFGNPLPSVSEMIKQSTTAESNIRDTGSASGREYDVHIQI